MDIASRLLSSGFIYEETNIVVLKSSITDDKKAYLLTDQCFAYITNQDDLLINWRNCYRYFKW